MRADCMSKKLAEMAEESATDAVVVITTRRCTVLYRGNGHLARCIVGRYGTDDEKQQATNRNPSNCIRGLQKWLSDFSRLSVFRVLFDYVQQLSWLPDSFQAYISVYIYQMVES